MTEYTFPPHPRSTVPIAGSAQQFPVRRIFCVGRNYAEHAREMGFDPDREPPFFFTKPADAVVHDGATIPYPALTENFHFEAELVVAIGKEGRNLSVEESPSYIWGYAVGNDLTRRDLQIQARERGALGIGVRHLTIRLLSALFTQSLKWGIPRKDRSASP